MKVQGLISQTPHDIKTKEYDLTELFQKQKVKIVFSTQDARLKYKKNCGQKLYRDRLITYDGAGSFMIQNYSVNLKKLNQSCNQIINIQRPLLQFSFPFSQYNFHGSTLVNNLIYFISSKNSQFQKSSAKVNRFNISNGQSSQIETTGEILSLNDSIVIESLFNMYVIVIQWQEQRIYGWSLMFGEWKKLNIINEIQKPLKFCSTVCNGKIYLLTVNVQSSQQNCYIYIYEITFSDIRTELQIKMISKEKLNGPSCQSQYKMTSLQERYLLICQVYTGMNQYETPNNQIKFEIYDLELRKRNIVNISYNSQNKISQIYSLCSHCNNVFLFFKQENENHIMHLYFSVKKMQNQSSFLTSKLCEEIEQTNKKTKDEMQFSTNMLHATAYSIKFPFQAIQKIIEFLQQKEHCSFVKINSQMTSNTVEKYLYVAFQFDCAIRQSQMSIQYYSQLITYCLRLGKTILLVENSPYLNQRRVILFSADARFTPLIEHLNVLYTYKENLTTLQTCPSQEHFKILVNNLLSTLVNQASSFINSIQNSKIFIFSPNIIPTPKTYFYELVFDSLSDISVFKNTKKIELIQKSGYILNNGVEWSLDKFLNYRNTKEKRAIISLGNSQANNQKAISYSAYLQLFQIQSKITKLVLPTLPYIQKIELYVCRQDFVLPQNNGVLLYHSNKLVNRYDCQFGQLLSQKFNGKKFFKKQKKNIFEIVGTIHVFKEMKLINFGTEFKKDRKYATMVCQLEDAICKAREIIQKEKQQKFEFMNG